ncbi:MAG TPA: sodium-translocating pyrophosphatase [Rectinemataceae bacterium]|nr:sodium-translocating pyrophosphatase [Rectinemataceae bacterium]
MNSDLWLYIGIGCGLGSIAAALVYYRWVFRQEPGTEKAVQIASWIKDGASTYLKMLYRALIAVAVVLVIVLGVIFSGDPARPLHGVYTAAAFGFGALCSALAGWLGMSIAVKANVRTATACGRSLGQGFNVAFKAGAVMGLAMVGVAVFGMSLLYLIFHDAEIVLGFSFGASSLALLAKAGGGIYTKTADIAADLTGKVELGIPEDDPRNPAVIADNVGDNVGDVAGMGADIFDSYVAATVASMLLGTSFAAAGTIGMQYAILPLILCIVGIVSALIGLQFVKVGPDGKPGKALNFGTVFSCVVFCVLATVLFVVVNAAAGETVFNYGALIATISGLVISVIIGFTTDYFTNDEFRPVRNVAEISASGTGLTIITGFSYGLISIAPALIGIVIATLTSYFSAQAFGLPGIYGVGIAAVGMLSLTGIVVSNDAYGPIVDNAKGIAEMSGMSHEVVDTADVLDSAGNTAKAITKGFSISAAALTVLAMYAAYSEVIVKYSGGSFLMNLQDPIVLSGIFLGCIVPPLFSALTMLAVTRNAFTMIEEIRRQFKAKPGILAGTELPDYSRCVGIASSGALRALVFPALLAVVLPLMVGFILGPTALGGFLGGAIFTGVVFALLMSNAGGLWDNAKKYIEAGNCGGPGSEAHKAAVVGDTVGDPFKDTAGPSLNTLITVMSLVSSLFAPLIAQYHLFG